MTTRKAMIYVDVNGKEEMLPLADAEEEQHERASAEREKFAGNDAVRDFYTAVLEDSDPRWVAWARRV